MAPPLLDSRGSVPTMMLVSDHIITQTSGSRNHRAACRAITGQSKSPDASHHFTLVLFFSERQSEQAIGCLHQSIRPSRLEVDFAATRARPSFETGDFYSNAFTFELL